MKFHVKAITGGSPYPEPESDWHLSMARELKEQFGLDHLTLAEVKTSWEQYSESMAASWLNPDKESVEYVFGVELEAIPELQLHSFD
jgi:hypothetical protein